MLIDLHVHTNISPCSNLKPDDMIKHAQEKGLDGVCITDHDTMDIRHILKEGIQDNGLCIIFGMEYETSEGDFLIFGPYEALQPGMDAVTLLSHVNETCGAAIAAHPFRKNRGLSKEIINTGLCSIIETCNGRNSAMENRTAQQLTESHDLIACGGSDAHALDELGREPTRLPHPIHSRRQLIQALKEGLCHPLSLENHGHLLAG